MSLLDKVSRDLYKISTPVDFRSIDFILENYGKSDMNNSLYRELATADWDGEGATPSTRFSGSEISAQQMVGQDWARLLRQTVITEAASDITLHPDTRWVKFQLCGGGGGGGSPYSHYTRSWGGYWREVCYGGGGGGGRSTMETLTAIPIVRGETSFSFEIGEGGSGGSTSYGTDGTTTTIYKDAELLHQVTGGKAGGGGGGYPEVSGIIYPGGASNIGDDQGVKNSQDGKSPGGGGAGGERVVFHDRVIDISQNNWAYPAGSGYLGPTAVDYYGGTGGGGNSGGWISTAGAGGSGGSPSSLSGGDASGYGNGGGGGFSIDDRVGAGGSGADGIVIMREYRINPDAFEGPLSDYFVAYINEPTIIDVTENDPITSEGYPSPVATVTQPTYGTAEVLTNGSVLYTPSIDYEGMDYFTYTNSLSRIGEVTISVEEED